MLNIIPSTSTVRRWAIGNLLMVKGERWKVKGKW
jgi:hypothetical protein